MQLFLLLEIFGNLFVCFFGGAGDDIYSHYPGEGSGEHVGIYLTRILWALVKNQDPKAVFQEVLTWEAWGGDSEVAFQEVAQGLLSACLERGLRCGGGRVLPCAGREAGLGCSSLSRGKFTPSNVRPLLLTTVCCCSFPALTNNLPIAPSHFSPCRSRTCSGVKESGRSRPPCAHCHANLVRERRPRRELLAAGPVSLATATSTSSMR